MASWGLSRISHSDVGEEPERGADEKEQRTGQCGGTSALGS